MRYYATALFLWDNLYIICKKEFTCETNPLSSIEREIQIFIEILKIKISYDELILIVTFNINSCNFPILGCCRVYASLNMENISLNWNLNILILFTFVILNGSSTSVSYLFPGMTIRPQNMLLSISITNF